MRIRSQKQLYIKVQSKSLSKSDELRAYGKLLENLPGYQDILEQVQRDLSPQCSGSKRGRNGMTAEQVLKSLLVKMRNNYSYRGLSEATRDSLSVRDFLGLSSFLRPEGFSFKTLQNNIKLLQESTLDMLDEELKKYARAEGIEDGKKTRTDAFNTASNIHYPTDWSLMNDSIRVLSRIMVYALEDVGVPLKFTNHYRASKKKLFKIHNTKSTKKRHKLNLELIRLTKKTLRYSESSLVVMREHLPLLSVQLGLKLGGLISSLEDYIPLVEQVIDQAHRRIVKKESVPAEEKIFSIFEDHTDIIVKGRRDITFGHKNTITTGKSGLVLNLEIHEGNPADSTLVEEAMKAHEEFYGGYPESAVFDGCYSSNENRKFAEEVGIKNTCFSKETDQESTCSRFIRRSLRNFRAGIEATVSMLMRMFGMKRIMNKGLASFKATAKAAVITYNMFILARRAAAR